MNFKQGQTNNAMPKDSYVFPLSGQCWSSQLGFMHFRAIAIAKMLLPWHCHCNNIQMPLQLPRYQCNLTQMLMVARLDFVIRGSGDLVSLRRETMQDLLPQAQNHCQTDMSRITFWEFWKGIVKALLGHWIDSKQFVVVVFVWSV